MQSPFCRFGRLYYLFTSHGHGKVLIRVIVRPVTLCDFLLHQLSSELAVDLSTCRGRLGQGVVAEYPRHVVKQPSDPQHGAWLPELIQAVKKKPGVLIALGGGEGQPVFGKRFVLRYLPSHQIELSQRVLGELIPGLRRTVQKFQRF